MSAVDVTEAPALPKPKLPKLIGSDNQVSWAADIRRQALRVLATTCANPHLEAAHAAASARIIDRIGPWLRDQKEARWWIDRRGVLTFGLACLCVQIDMPADLYAEIRPDVVVLRRGSAPAAPAPPRLPTVTVTQRLAELIVTSPYDADYVVGVKALGARWDAASRTWAVPLKERDRLRDLLLKRYRTDGGLPAPAAPEPNGSTAPTAPTVASVGAIDHLLADLRAEQADS